MESRDHFLASSITAPIFSYYLYEPSTIFSLILYSYIGAAIGILIDLDHYPVYRYLKGDWRDLKKSLKNPKKVMEDHTTITVFSERKKYIAHSISFTLVLGAIWVFQKKLFPLAASMLALHLLMDLYSTHRNGPVPPQRSLT